MKQPFIFDDGYDEEKLKKTIAVSKQAFLEGERERGVSRLEFLYQQSRYMKKRWWLLQGLLLAAVCLLLCQAETDYAIRRCLGLAGPLLGVLLLPELWKNRSCDALEVECTTLYTLRAIYSARLTLFAGVDLVLLSAFFAGASVLTQVTVWEMLIQFLLPFNVTCVICLGTLYSRKWKSETLSMVLCLVWAAVWLLVMERNVLYDAISAPLWVLALAGSFCCLGYTVLRGQRNWKMNLEARAIWN